MPNNKMTEQLDWSECEEMAKNLPGREHTVIRTTRDLSADEDYRTMTFLESKNVDGITISTYMENDVLKVVKTPKLSHVLGIGSSGSGKSQGFILNNLFNATGKTSMIITDPKGELARASYARLCDVYGKENVLIENFLTPEHSQVLINPFYPLAKEWLSAEKKPEREEIHKEIISKIRKYLETIFVLPVHDKDISWYETARNFIFGIVMGLYEDLTLTTTEAKKTKRSKVLPEQINWKNIIRIFQLFSWGTSYRGNFDDKGFFKTRNEKTSTAYSLAKTTIFNASNTLANYMGFVELYLRTVSDPKILEISRYNNLDITSLGESPKALFLVYDMSDITLREYVNTIATSFVNELLEHSHKAGNQLKVPVILYLDEFPTLAPNPVYPNVLATGRGSGLYMHIICQSVTQLQARYPNDYQSMIENCDLTFFMGTNDRSTAEYFSKELGHTTIPDPVAFLQNTFSCLTVPVVSEDKLMHRMEPGEVFLKVHHKEPIHGNFEFYYKATSYKVYPPYEINKFSCNKSIPEEKLIYDMQWMCAKDDDEDDDDLF